MRPIQTDDIKVQGSLGGEVVAFSLDEASLQHLMTQFIDLYSNPALAVLREYSTNAWDSHIEAGTTRPIEVSLPGGLSPFLRIKDYGVGLSAADIRDVYSKYGASTKRDTDEQTGMLGLGCKSALTYTNQFTMIAVQHGVLVNAAIRRESNGGAVVEFVGDAEYTDKPDGVEIVIPCKDHQAMRAEATKFFKAWRPGTVLVDGKQPEHYSGRRVGDSMQIIESSYDIVVMGNVSYPVDKRISQDWYLGYIKAVIAWVPIGSVQPTPNREKLIYKQHTLATLDKLRREFSDKLVKAAQDDVRDAESAGEAVKLTNYWRGVMLRKRLDIHFTYDGQLVPSKLKQDGWLYRRNVTRRAVLDFKDISLDDSLFSDRTLLVHGFDEDDFTVYKRTKLRKYMEYHNHNHAKVYITAQKFGSPWLDSLATLDWQQVKDFRLPAKARAKSAGKFNIYQVGKGFELTNDFSGIGAEVYYYSSVEKYSGGSLKKLFPNAAIAEVPKNRWATFQRAFPQAKHVKEIIDAKRKELLDKLTPLDRVVIKVDYYTQRDYKNLDPARIDDPDCKALVEYIRTGQDSPGVLQYKEWKRSFGAIKIDATNPFDRYPMVAYAPLYHPDAQEQVYAYMNLTYKEQQNAR